MGGRRVRRHTVNPLHRPVDAELLMVGGTAYLARECPGCGLHLLTDQAIDQTDQHDHRSSQVTAGG
jgi:hypothetical protein